jgi:hypothetical protein
MGKLTINGHFPVGFPNVFRVGKKKVALTAPHREGRRKGPVPL